MGGRRGGRKKFQLKRPKGKKNNNLTEGSSSAATPPWIELPRDVTANILSRLRPVEILENAQKVCTTWRGVCLEPSLWRVIDMKYSDDDVETHYDADIICRRAVDLSQGELIDINIEHFGTDDLLCYISDRSSHVKRLRLGCCDCISGHGLSTSVKNFPELQELHLFFMPLIDVQDIETIGISCPTLKSFTFNNRRYKYPFMSIDDKYALAIAKNMPNLHHLRLFGNKLSEEGLEAILDGCPYLESLDLRQCFGVNIQGCDIWKRCLEQIKNVRGPYDSTADYEWDAQIYDDEDDMYDNFSDVYSTGDDYADLYGDIDEYENYYDNYDDYTNPFNDLPYPANMAWYLDRDDYL